MDLVFILAQLIGLFAVFFSLKSFVQYSKKKYIVDSIIAAIFNSVHYLLLGAYTGVLIKIMAFIREIFLYKKETNKKYNKLIIFIILVTCYLFAGIFTFNNNIINLLPVISAVTYFFAEWFGNLKAIKILGIITTVLWLIYNIAVLSITGIIYNLITIITLIYSLTKMKKSKRKSKKKSK